MTRIPPGPPDDPNLPEGLPPWNVFTTFARHPKLFRDWLRFGGRLLGRGELPARDRELLILRTAVRCDAPYEWGQHVRIGLESGLEREEVDRVPAGPEAPGWSDHDATLLRAADELHDTSTLSDATWAALAERYDEHQLIETVMLVGHYHMVAFALNAFGVELDEGLEGFP
jgi:alkylhydroperoxidase family enzyme